MPMTVRYTTLNGRVISQNRKRGGYAQLMRDPLGNVIATADSAGAKKGDTTYWPYGEVRTGGVSADTPFGFCGTWGYYTDASGRQYVRARYYRPTLGRWQTVDPLWPKEGAYEYARLAPISTFDRSGTQVAIGGEALGEGARSYLCCAKAGDKAMAKAEEFCERYGWKNHHENICNAMQHCLWACMIAQDCEVDEAAGRSLALECTNKHEETAPPYWKNCPGYRPDNGKPNPPQSSCMDLYNNRIGINCSSAIDCYQCCLQHARSGGFQVVNQPGTMPKGWRRPKSGCKTHPELVKMPPI